MPISSASTTAIRIAVVLRANSQLAPIYALFRDRILLQALTEIRNELMESMGQDTLPTLQYVMKRTARQNGVATPRAVQGWETRNVTSR